MTFIDFKNFKARHISKTLLIISIELMSLRATSCWCDERIKISSVLSNVQNNKINVRTYNRNSFSRNSPSLAPSWLGNGLLYLQLHLWILIDRLTPAELHKRASWKSWKIVNSVKFCTKFIDVLLAEWQQGGETQFPGYEAGLVPLGLLRLGSCQT